MSRIRTIKPEFPQSESTGRISREARLLFILLWTIVDDEGRARAASRMLASLLYPYDDDAPALIDDWLYELEQEKCIRRYEIDGSTYLEIINWKKHQKIDRPSKSRLPEFNAASHVFASPREPSRVLDADLGPGPGPGKDDPSSSLRSEEGVVPSDEGTKPKRKSKRRKIAYTSDFEAFWKGYPTDANMGKEETFLFWQKIDPEERELAIRSLPAFNEYCRKNPDYRPVHAVRYLSKKRFEGHAQAHAETPAPNVTPMAKRFWADVDSERWKAHDRYLKSIGKVGASETDARPDGPDTRLRRGWYFESPWPPGHDAERQRAA
jgi:hypothetical protein